MAGDATPAPFTAETIRRNLTTCQRDSITLGHEGCRDLVARALARWPYLHQLDVLAGTVFVMTGPGQVAYLSAKLIGDRNFVVLKEELLALPEDDQLAVVLSQMAHCVLRSRHSLESPAEFPIPLKLWRDGTRRARRPGAAEVEEYEARVWAFDDEAVNLKIDAHFSKQKADGLARSWLAE